MFMAFLETKCLRVSGSLEGHSSLRHQWAGVAFGPDGGLPAGGAVGWHLEGGILGVVVGFGGSQDLGDDVAGAFDDDGLAGSEVAGLDVILVMEGGALDGDAADGDGFEDGDGG